MLFVRIFRNISMALILVLAPLVAFPLATNAAPAIPVETSAPAVQNPSTSATVASKIPTELVLERPIDLILPATASDAPVLPTASEILANETYTQATVKVEKVAETSEIARSDAFLEAETRALESVLRRQTPERAEAILSQLDFNKIKKMVKNYEVKQEIKTATTYRGTLTITFEPEAISAMIGGRIRALPDPGIAPSKPLSTKEITTNTTLIVPVYDVAGNQMLWETDNVWRKALNRAALEYGQNKVVMPTGDPKDTRELTLKKAYEGRYADFESIIKRYGTQEVLVLIASQEKAQALSPLKVSIRRLQQGNTQDSYQTFAAKTGESDIARLTRTAEEMMQHSAATFRENLAPASKETQQRIRAIAKIIRAVDWAQMRKKLVALPMIQSVDPIDISTSQVEMDIAFQGAPAELGKAMKEAHIYVTPLKDKLLLSAYPSKE